MTELAWIDAALTAARPQAVGALLRYFRDLDTAEEAYQDACLRALKTWPQNGPPRDPGGLADHGRPQRRPRRRAPARQAGAAAAGGGDLRPRRRRDAAGRAAGRRRTTATTCCACCSSAAIPTCPRTQQIALALRIVSGLSVQQIARAFLVGEAAMEQRITRAKARIAAGTTCRSKRPARWSAPNASPRSRRWSISCSTRAIPRRRRDRRARRLCATRRSGWRRLLLRLFPTEPEIMGLTALMLLQHARAPARFDADGRDRAAGGPGPRRCGTAS